MFGTGLGAYRRDVHYLQEEQKAAEKRLIEQQKEDRQAFTDRQAKLERLLEILTEVSRDNKRRLDILEDRLKREAGAQLDPTGPGAPSTTHLSGGAPSPHFSQA